jgi:hypothetical protein
LPRISLVAAGVPSFIRRHGNGQLFHPVDSPHRVWTRHPSGLVRSAVHLVAGGLLQTRPRAAQPTHLPFGPRYPGLPWVPNLACAAVAVAHTTTLAMMTLSLPVGSAYATTDRKPIGSSPMLWPGERAHSRLNRTAARFVKLGHEAKIARMEDRRVHAHQRDRVPGIVNGDHCVSVAIVNGSDACC